MQRFSGLPPPETEKHSPQIAPEPLVETAVSEMAEVVGLRGGQGESYTEASGEVHR